MRYQFKIKIKGITKPPVWRRIIVPSDCTFLRFHQAIQVAFGWDDCHLFEFQDKEWDASIRLSIPSEDDYDFGVETQNAAKVKLSKVFGVSFCKLLYIYDFGDSWVHEIVLEDILDDKSKILVCLSGKGSCPPENCGGACGYEYMKNILKTMPDSEEANSYKDWLGIDRDKDWDATVFDIDEVNENLKNV